MAGPSDILPYNSLVSFNDVIGMKEAKHYILERIALPLKFPQFFSAARSWYGQCMLIYGPPGVGKTLFSNAVCNTKKYISPDSKIVSYRLRMYNLLNRQPYCEQDLQQFHRVFTVALSNTPSIIILDDFEVKDNLDRIVRSDVLMRLEDVNKHRNCWVICLSQKPWTLSRSFHKRICKRMYIRPPDHECRCQLIKYLFKDIHHDLMENDFEELALRTFGFTGSDIVLLCRDSSLQPLRSLLTQTHFKKVCVDEKEAIFKFKSCDPQETGAQPMTVRDIDPSELIHEPVKLSDCIKSLSSIRPSVNAEDLTHFDDYTQQHGNFDDQLSDNKMVVESLQAQCTKCIADRLCSLNPPVNIEQVISTQLPLPKKLLLLVMKQYATSLQFTS